MTTKKQILMDRSYSLYCEYPMPTIQNLDPFLFEKGWCVQYGMSIMAPHPYRHFTKDEFYEMIEKDIDFAEFAMNLFEQARKEYMDGITNRINEGGL